MVSQYIAKLKVIDPAVEGRITFSAESCYHGNVSLIFLSIWQLSLFYTNNQKLSLPFMCETAFFFFSNEIQACLLGPVFVRVQTIRTGPEKLSLEALKDRH